MIHSLYTEIRHGAWSPACARFLAALDETYGADTFGPGGARAALHQAAPALRQALAPAPAYGLEATCAELLQTVSPLLPGTPPDLYLATLLFTAPAATISMGGHPAIALGLERFHLQPPSRGPKYWYHPREAVEMIPHEGAHAARMQVLGLPPTPSRLSLLDMVMLEGTALTFTDLLLGRETLATFLPPERLAWHRANDRAVRLAVAADFGRTGMPVFARYFGADAAVSGYYVGNSLCRAFLDRHGAQSMRALLALPSQAILAALADFH